MKPSPLWELIKKDAGISRSKFRAYFKGCNKAYIYRLGKFLKYDTHKGLIELEIKSPLQSFILY